MAKKTRSEKTGIPAGAFILAAFYHRERKREAASARDTARYNERQEDIGTRKIVRARNSKINQLKRISAIKKNPSQNGILQLREWLASPDTDPMIKVAAAEVLSRWALNDLRGDLRVRL